MQASRGNYGGNYMVVFQITSSGNEGTTNPSILSRIARHLSKRRQGRERRVCNDENGKQGHEEACKEREEREGSQKKLTQEADDSPIEPKKPGIDDGLLLDEASQDQ